MPANSRPPKDAAAPAFVAAVFIGATVVAIFVGFNSQRADAWRDSRAQQAELRAVPDAAPGPLATATQRR